MFVQHLEYALNEFGSKAFYGWTNSVADTEQRLRENPRTYTIEPLLRHLSKEYRGRTIMKHFKLIYSYDESKAIVYIETIWDMRMNPEKLENRVLK